MAPGSVSDLSERSDRPSAASLKSAAITIGSPPPRYYATGVDVRLASRNGEYSGITSGQASSYMQASPVILPSRYARDFKLLCARNPVPCPLLAQADGPGIFDRLKSNIPGVSDEEIAGNLDIRRDTPRYMVFQDGGVVKKGCPDVMADWTDDHTAFLIGCSYSFETALAAAGLTPRHVLMGYNCPMYRTKLPLNPAGVFTGSTYGVSMRTYKQTDVSRVIEITRAFVYTHGEPLAWGWDAFESLGQHRLAGMGRFALDGGWSTLKHGIW